MKLKCWVNGDFYVPSTETLGILPIPADVRTLSGMTEFNANTDSKQYYAYFATMQGTHKPILPVHTFQEHSLFCELMKSDTNFMWHNWRLSVVK